MSTSSAHEVGGTTVSTQENYASTQENYASTQENYASTQENYASDGASDGSLKGPYLDAGKWLVSSRFWVCSRPFFESTLFVVPRAVLVPAGEGPEFGKSGFGKSELPGGSPDPMPGGAEGGPVPCSSATQVTLYDCDGALINTIEVNFPLGEVGLLPLDAFLESCKLENGFRQAQALVRSQSLVQHLCAVRLQDSEGLFSAAVRIDEGSGDFLPVTIAPNRSIIVGLLNLANREAEVRCRLFVGVRSPEITVLLPPGGTRTLCVDGQGTFGLTDGVLQGRGEAPAGVASKSARANGTDRNGFAERSEAFSGQDAGVSPTQSYVGVSPTQSYTAVSPTQGYLRFTAADGAEVAAQVMELLEGESTTRLLQTA